MSTPDDEIELLDPVPEFRGTAQRELLQAQANAEAQLAAYWPAIVAKLGLPVAEWTLQQATAHYLATTRSPLAQPDTPHSPRHGYQVGRPGELGAWAGSPYGDGVARILRQVKEGTRRCGGIATVPL